MLLQCSWNIEMETVILTVGVTPRTLVEDRVRLFYCFEETSLSSHYGEANNNHNDLLEGCHFLHYFDEQGCSTR